MTLLLTRLKVEQVRKFRQPFELTGLQPGLNLFSGDNEAGKSTLVRAIRAAFFERHGTNVVEDLRPWGDAGATPQVEIDFRLDGEDGQLFKRFLGKKRCQLRLGSRTLEGTEAEDLLAERLGYAYAAKGASKTEHWGIPGLLWIEQGSGQDIHDAAGHAREHLHGALQRGGGGQGADAVGALAASAGDGLLARLLERRGELLTGTGKPRAALAEAIERVVSLDEQRRELDQRIDTYRRQVDLLDALRRAHAADERERPWQALERDLVQARGKLAALQDSQRQLTQDQQRHAGLQAQVGLLQQQIQAAQQQADGLQRREVEQARTQSARETADAAAQQARERLEAAQALAAQAAALSARWRAQASRAEQLRQQRELQAAQSTRQVALTQAEAAAATLARLRAQAGARALSDEVVKTLRQLDARRRELATRRDAAATRLALDLLPGVTLTLQADGVADQALSGTSRQVLVRPTTLDIPGFGRLTISPGGQDLDELARQLADTDGRWQAALAQAGVADLSGAEQRLAQHADLLRQIGLAEQALALQAPQGIDALRQAQAEGAARLAQVEAARALIGDMAEPDPSVDPIVALAQAESDQKAADAAVQRAQQASTTAGQQLAAATTAEVQARHERDALAALLADPERQAQAAKAAHQLLEASAERDALALRIEQTAQALAQARPAIVEQDVQRLGASVTQQTRAHQQRREQILVLETQLAEAGAQGLDEQLAHVDGEQVRAIARRDQLQRRADALALLCRELAERRAATLAQLQGPLTRHLQHHLALLFPQATLSVDARLAPGELTRADAHGRTETGAIDALSFGAREQLGLIARCAYADLLLEAGRPTLLILDDALVHSDAQRLAQMKRVLYDVAQRHQVLLFTCHPEDWRDLGVQARPIHPA
ncbi:AAA family ATPase [Sphaerotilus mobilis]|uniref:DNA repair exonuclease SbcCD ATPase subunit n=1 Tax=Sphaerotilus mobilis TaxID=47994 RepID=A0A4Q7LBH3_9BURK|nr:AAA family ATPase [Sphaerotilus mobilis]RZS46761.1 DNA repair exonuclease SbcCD ATPase subunit [Sphaerotilus mobilis]